MAEGALRLAEPLAALSLVTDLGMGHPPESAIRAALLACLLAQSMGVGDDDRRDVYYATILRSVGCISTAYETSAALGGDDIEVQRRMMFVDAERPAKVLPVLLDLAGRDKGPLGRAQRIAGVLTHGKATGAMIGRSHCEVASRLAQRFGLSGAVSTALYQLAERWDGRGVPAKLKGEQIELPTRFAAFAHVAVSACAEGGVEASVPAVHDLAGRVLDPDISQAYCRDAGDLLGAVSTADCWERLLGAEPEPHTTVPAHRLEDVAAGFADAVDMKSPWLHSHSSGVADLAARAAKFAGWGDEQVRTVRLAGLLHDIGRVGVPSGLWDRAGSLSVGEWEQVRLHPYHTERILSRSPLLAPLARLAGSHHERLDGSGYHKASDAATVEPLARVLAAADVFHALTEARPHRAARTAEDAAQHLAAEADARRLDRDATAAVCEAAGQAPPPRRRDHPNGLTDREVDVLRLLAQGLTKKDMAHALHLSTSTVHTHVVHIYDKIGLSTRAGAALFAMEHDLLRTAGNQPFDR